LSLPNALPQEFSSSQRWDKCCSRKNSSISAALAALCRYYLYIDSGMAVSHPLVMMKRHLHAVIQDDQVQ
jgi:hypothetical protein